MRKYSAAVLQMSAVARPDIWQAPLALDGAQQRKAAPLDRYLWPHLDLKKSTYSDLLYVHVNGRQRDETASQASKHGPFCSRGIRTKEQSSEQHILWSAAFFKAGGATALGGFMRRKGNMRKSSLRLNVIVPQMSVNSTMGNTFHNGWEYAKELNNNL